jgi:hypothetical protein
MRLIAVFLAMLVLPAAAHAEWFEASSTNFVIYANDSERDIRKFTEQLERYHEAMTIVTGLQLAPPSPSNRVTVYVVGNVSKVQRLFGAGGRNIGGFYIPRAGASAAFVPSINVSRAADFSMHTLLHEYAHHVLLSNSSLPSPRWLGEGGAEFFSGARFSDDGGLTLGLYEESSFYQFRFLDNVTAEELVDPEQYDGSRAAADSFYSKSWLLYHYLTFDEARRGQLRKYVGLMAAGKSSRDAAIEAFGDLRELEVELSGYMNRPRMMSMVFKPGQLQPGPVTIRKLRAGEAEIMPVRIASRRGVNPAQARELLADARAVAAKYADDPAVEAALAEAEYDAGNDAEAIAAADAAIATDPAQVNAYIQKGYALFRRAADATPEERPDAYREAAAPFLALNKLEPDHPLPLFFYYLSFAARDEEPPPVAVQGLERALEVAAFDLVLRMALVGHQISSRDYQAARRSLGPVAYNPHGGALAAAAASVIDFLDTQADPDPEEVMKLLAPLSEGAGEAAGHGDDGDEDGAGEAADGAKKGADNDEKDGQLDQDNNGG